MSLLFAPCPSATNPTLHIADSPMTLGRSGVTGTSRGAGSVVISVPACGMRMHSHFQCRNIDRLHHHASALVRSLLARQLGPTDVAPTVPHGGQNHIKQQKAAGLLPSWVNCVLGVLPCPTRRRPELAVLVDETSRLAGLAGSYQIIAVFSPPRDWPLPTSSSYMRNPWMAGTPRLVGAWRRCQFRSLAQHRWAVALRASLYSDHRSSTLRKKLAGCCFRSISRIKSSTRTATQPSMHLVRFVRRYLSKVCSSTNRWLWPLHSPFPLPAQAIR
jgi:hypothetical protein